VIVSNCDGASTATPGPDSISHPDRGPAVPIGPAEHRRWLVHCGLIATVAAAIATLTLTPSLALHIAAGLVFAGLVVAHLHQRRRTTRALTAALLRLRSWLTRRGQLAMSDLFLAFLGANAVLSGIVDWLSGHKQPLPLPGGVFVSWHGASALLLTGYLVVHVVRRRARLRSSRIR
jgi:hypothetical protein